VFTVQQLADEQFHAVNSKGNGGSQTATAVAALPFELLLDCANCGSVSAAQTRPAVFSAAGFPDAGGSGPYSMAESSS
jgi:hypothetical protein